VLEISGLTVRFGETTALDDFTLIVSNVVAVVGPAGAGKTSLLEAIAGLVPAIAGAIALGGERLDGCSTPERVRRGVCYVPVRRGLFPGLTVAENMALMLPEPEDAEVAYASFPVLANRRRVRAGGLSGGEQRVLALARALSRQARLVMVDEPFDGLAPRSVAATADTLIGLAAERGKTVLISDVNGTRAARVAQSVVHIAATRGPTRRRPS
jgi:branched-chain amino acid transport system ATP-binding protein